MFAFYWVLGLISCSWPGKVFLNLILACAVVVTESSVPPGTVR